MIASPIGYYVHHHGQGHLDRALAITRASPERFVLLGTGLVGKVDGQNFIELADDAPHPGASISLHTSRPHADVLHYAPRNHAGVRARVARIAEWIAAVRPSLIVADVSVEVAMLARLTSTPSVYVRLNGYRSDAAHGQAFASAEGLLAPFAEPLDDEDTPSDLRRKTFYAAGLTPRPPTAIRPKGILGIVGRGCGLTNAERWAIAARALPDVTWAVAGPGEPPQDLPTNLVWLGWVDNISTWIASAEVVVGAAGDGVVGGVIAARRPYICIPEARPFDEQVRKAERLAAFGAAIVQYEWPSQSDWSSLVARALRLDTGVLAALDAVDGPDRAAAWLASVADEVDATT